MNVFLEVKKTASGEILMMEAKINYLIFDARTQKNGKFIHKNLNKIVL